MEILQTHRSNKLPLNPLLLEVSKKRSEILTGWHCISSHFPLHKTKPSNKEALLITGLSLGSGGRDRTYDQSVNSRLLYR
jgi:hypothetical protein